MTLYSFSVFPLIQDRSAKNKEKPYISLLDLIFILKSYTEDGWDGMVDSTHMAKPPPSIRLIA